TTLFRSGGGASGACGTAESRGIVAVSMCLGMLLPSFGRGGYPAHMRPRDTTTEAHRAQIEIWRAMSPARKVRLAIEMSERAREIAIAGVMAREPGISRETARRRVLRGILGDALFEAGYGRRGDS
ncbi:hypothetical protein K2X89_09935, partial [Myxococcota bacterium]|nr:hypothetical protein [Myxococcota bacterium]